MADLLSYSLRSTFAREFFQSLTDPKSNDRYYIYYGRPKLWGATVPSAQDTIKEQNDAKRNTLFYQLITPSDVALVVNRYNWTSGIVYDEYEDDVALWVDSKKYYVLVNDGNDQHVYVCLSNNNGAVSTSVPIGTDVEEVITADGYVWKYLYSLSNELQTFLTTEYMPVVVLDQISYTDERALALNVKANAVNGSIQRVTVDTQDVVFENLINPSLTENYFVQEVISSLTFTVNLQDLNSNSNYYNTNYVVYFENGQIGTIDTYTVSGNTATIVLCELIGDPIQQGDRYSIVPKVNITGSGTGAVAVARFQNNILTSVDVINGGQDYGFAEAFFYVQTTATLSAVIPPDGGHGYDLMTELKPTRILINKQLTFNPVTEEEYFAAGSVLSQYGIVKNLKTTQGTDVSQATNEYDMVLTTPDPYSVFSSTGTGSGAVAEFIEFTGSGIGTITVQEYQKPFDTVLILNYSAFNNDTGRGVNPAASYNTAPVSPFKDFFKVGDIISNRENTFTGYGEFIGKVINVEVYYDGTYLTGGTRIYLQLLRGSEWYGSVKCFRGPAQDPNDTRVNYQALSLIGNDALSTVSYYGNNFSNYTFYNFIRFKNSTGQGHAANNYGANFFSIGDTVIQKDENLNEIYRGKVLQIIEPGMSPAINQGGYNSFTFYGIPPAVDNRRNCTIILENISGTPQVPTSVDLGQADILEGDGDLDGANKLRQKNCFYNLSKNSILLGLLSTSERINSINQVKNSINTKGNLLRDRISWNQLTASTHILGNESFSIAQIKQNSFSIDPNNPRRLNMKIVNPSDDFIPATITGGNVTEGESATFLKQRGSLYSFAPALESYASDYIFILEENYNKVATESSIQTLNASNIKKIQIKRVGSTVLNDTVIPVLLTGSYLYRESNATQDSASGYILSIGTSQVVNGVDSVIDVYYLEEKGTFEVDDDIIIVEDPFVPVIRQIGLGAVTSVTLKCNSTPSAYNNTFVNKYSGEVLHIQNIEPVNLTTDTNFTTRILLGF